MSLHRLILAIAVITVTVFLFRPVSADSHEGISRITEAFANPPDQYKPWVYWFWNNGNLTAEGITADLEAMQRVGIKGVLIMEVGQAPKGPVDFMGDRWRELFRFMVEEAARLGIEINMNSGPGWNGTGGPWVSPENGMQILTWSETTYIRRNSNALTMPKPESRLEHYRDIALLAFPTPKNSKNKEPLDPDRNTRSFAKSTPEAVVPIDQIIDLTDKMRPNGIVDWDPPAGSNWTLLRIGHSCKGNTVFPAPDAGVGPECDKLSKKAVEAAFAGQIKRLAEENKQHLGKTFVSTHVDSWENGSQNWTPLMREEFLERQGYDILPYLPVFAGYVVGSVEITERFLWDFRRTVSAMVLDNYVRHLHKIAHEYDLGLTIEAYGSPCDFIEYGGIADEPMGEFWIGVRNMITSVRPMVSAGHVYGRNIIGAEAFTAGAQERWLEHPGSIKALGDRVFAEGINRFVFHRYSFQPWKNVRPGLMMGPWGVHYERTQTWWEQSVAWHDYLGRCQFMLQQGVPVTDICYIEPETAPETFTDHPRNGYPWNQCGTHAVLTMRVENGRVVLPSGTNYQILVLPKTDRMTIKLLKKTLELITHGATVVGNRPIGTYGLADYPNNEKRVAEIADQIWGVQKTLTGNRAIGTGRIIWGMAPEGVLAEQGTAPDFCSDADLHAIHRRTTDADIYFVANIKDYPVMAKAYFRAEGTPELLCPESGKRTPVSIFSREKNVTGIMLPLKATQSTFVLFNRETAAMPHNDQITTVLRDGEPVADLTSPPPKIEVIRAVYRNKDVTEFVAKIIKNGFVAVEVDEIAKASASGSGTDVGRLQIDYRYGTKTMTVSGKNNETVYLSPRAVKIKVLSADYGPPHDSSRIVNVTELLQSMFDAGENEFLVYQIIKNRNPAEIFGKVLRFKYEFDGKISDWSGDDKTMVVIDNPSPQPLPLVQSCDDSGTPCLEIRLPGNYEFRFASGRSLTEEIQLPSLMVVAGAWNISFPKKEVVFDKLISWSDSEDEAIKYFSGTAVYRKSVDFPNEFFGLGKRIRIDLGNVDSIAELKINGKSVGTLWTLDKTIDVTDFLVAGGPNELEIAVTNLWPNRLVGDDFLPPNSERNAGGALVQWPQWLLEGKPDPSGRETFCMLNSWRKEHSLISSGLIGPVRFAPVKQVPLK